MDTGARLGTGGCPLPTAAGHAAVSSTPQRGAAKGPGKKDRRRHRHARARLDQCSAQDAPTATVVMLGNVSTDAGMSEPQLQELLGSEPGLAGLSLGLGKPYALLRFDCAAAARAAKSRLDGLWCRELKRLLCAELVDGAVATGQHDPLKQAADSPPRWVANNTSGRDRAAAAAAAAERGETPGGLIVLSGVVTEAEEDEILEALEQRPWDTLSRRQVQHYGHRFDYATNTANSGAPNGGGARVELPPPFPPFCEWLVPRLLLGGDGDGSRGGAVAADVGAAGARGTKLAGEGGSSRRMRNAPNQLTVNRYTPGGGIPPHVDTHSAFEHSIASVSLGSDVVMEFLPHDAQGSCGAGPARAAHKVAVHLPRRSLLVLNDASRYAWQHMIATRKTDMIDGRVVPRQTRTSLTFRTLRAQPCECKFPRYCDHPRPTSD